MSRSSPEFSVGEYVGAKVVALAEVDSGLLCMDEGFTPAFCSTHDIEG